MDPGAERGKETILIIDDEEEMCIALERVLAREGFSVRWTTSALGIEGWVRRENPACCLLDLKLADCDGLTVLARIRATDKDVPVIMLTAYDTVKTAVQAMKQGAFHYMSKPFDNEELKILVSKAIEGWRLSRRVKELEEWSQGADDDLERTMGSSPQIRELIKTIHSVAGSDVNVLLLGESGSGKELAARGVHRFSKRKGGPFIPVDCASIPETLIESELFGHERGAFTGANESHRGCFEEANGGTIFLDEIGNIPLATQPKLLRFLESHELRRIGGSRAIRTSVRVIAATNSDLSDGVKTKGFRLDLLHRLNEFPIQLPSLRDRREDIPFLANLFLKQFQAEMGLAVEGITPAALEVLEGYDFPGNVRELRNILKRSMVVARGKIDVSDLPPEIRAARKDLRAGEISVSVPFGHPMKEATRQAMEQIERSLIVDALRRSDGRHTRAALLLGVDPKTLYNKMKEYGI